MTANRFPRGVYSAGREPDARFSLANERTFLAWIRTALAFVAGAVALEALDVPVQPALRITASMVLVAAALVLVGQAWLGWTRTEKALRHDRPLPAPFSALPTVIALALVATLVGVGLLMGR